MKKLLIIVLTFMTIFSCKNHKNALQKYSSKNDSLLIRTQKQKGDGLFALGLGSINFSDVDSIFSYSIIYPENIDSLKRGQIKADYKEKKTNYVDILIGIKNNSKVVIVDENNNNDLSDDAVHEIKEINWFSSEGIIQCKYFISNGKKIVEDSSWIKVASYGKSLLIGRNEFLKANFKFNNIDYELGIADEKGAFSFTYDNDPKLALLKTKENKKDTFNPKDLLSLDEYFNLDGYYYRFANIRNNGDYITLVKEPDFKSKVGTQIGMIAPKFEVKNLNGDTLTSESLNNKLTIIANSCGCGGDKESPKAYTDILETFGDVFNILNLDSDFEIETDGVLISMKDSFNKKMYEDYRKEYCSRIVYVIGKDNRIIDKFEILNWKPVLDEISKLND